MFIFSAKLRNGGALGGLINGCPISQFPSSCILVEVSKKRKRVVLISEYVAVRRLLIGFSGLVLEFSVNC